MAGGPRGEVRVLGGTVPGEPGPPRRSVLIAAGVLAGAALGATFLSLSGGDGIDASLITDPALQPDPFPPTTVAVDYGDPLPPVAVPNPLDAPVPGFAGTLVMTTDSPAGLEVWTWTAGPEGTLTRDPVLGDLVDARPDATGAVVAALRRHGDDPPWLVVTNGTDVTPVFFGARSFAWHATAPGEIAWLALTSPTDSPTLYIGVRNDGGLYFKPLANLTGFAEETTSRLVGYDTSGFVVETWTRGDGGSFTPSVQRLDPSGRPVASLEGYFVGVAPDGTVAVGETTVTDTPAGTFSLLPAASTSAVWSPGGDRLAITADAATSVTIEDTAGTAQAFFDLGADHLTVRAWSPDGRFVIVSGYVGDDALLVFIDTAMASVRPVPIDGHPIGLVVVP